MIKGTDLTILKKDLRKKGKLYLVDPKSNKPVEFSSREELFATLIDLGTKGYHTFNEDGTLHDTVTSFRTLEDLFRIVIFYHPKIALGTLLVYLWDNCSWKDVCTKINKRTYRAYSSRYGLNTTPSQTKRSEKDEYGYSWDDYMAYVKERKSKK